MDLWQQMQQVAARAQASGALLSIEHEVNVIEQDGVPYVVRYAPQLMTKLRAARQTPARDPFLPPEAELQVAAVGRDYQLILNKYNVMPLHGLLVTNAYVAQTDQLCLADFNAVSQLLDQVDGLVFYNGGPLAGASQAHRHFQLVPTDLGAGVLPIAGAVEACLQHQRKRLFPFTHRLVALPDWQPATLLDSWHKLEFAWQPYNLLLTRRWMLVVPRRAEHWQGISINSLGFAGALLAKDDAELAAIEQAGPLSLLQQVVADG